DAAANGGRVRVNVQWGKHGSLPAGWEKLKIRPDAGDVERAYMNLSQEVSLLDYNRATYEKLHTEGRRLPDHPLGRRWPRTFAGSWADFVRFDKFVDIRSMLEKREMAAVSRWNNATLQQRFLAYNFRPKTEWPDSPDLPLRLESQLERRIGSTLDR